MGIGRERGVGKESFQKRLGDGADGFVRLYIWCDFGVRTKEVLYWQCV